MLGKVLKVFGGLVALFLVAGGGFYLWAGSSSAGLMERSVEVHDGPFPVPFPLTEAEVVEAGFTPEEADALALERAIERGRHLVRARYACTDCHGENLGGGVMVDAFPIGTVLGPNLTRGQGSRVLDFTASDWDRIVRHGVRADGRPAMMPSVDFRSMSDQELSDVISFIGSLPPVDNEVAEPTLGPLGKILVATGQMPFSADRLASVSAHEVLPPAADVTVEFGGHLAAVCAGCHGVDLSGGPMLGGDPSWPEPLNLTPHPEGLADWTFEDFERALRGGIRPDGTELAMPMTLALEYTRNMTDVEVRALWMYLRSVPALPTGG